MMTFFRHTSLPSIPSVVMLLELLLLSITLALPGELLAEDGAASNSLAAVADVEPTQSLEKSDDKSSTQSRFGKKAEDNSTFSEMLLEMILGLILVIAVMSAMAFIYRRTALFNQAHHQGLKIVTVLSVGPKQKIVLVKMLSSHFLIGVTDHNVNLLKEFTAEDESELAAWLGQAKGKTSVSDAVDQSMAEQTTQQAASFNDVLKKIWSKTT